MPSIFYNIQLEIWEYFLKMLNLFILNIIWISSFNHQNWFIINAFHIIYIFNIQITSFILFIKFKKRRIIINNCINIEFKTIFTILLLQINQNQSKKFPLIFKFLIQFLLNFLKSFPFKPKILKLNKIILQLLIKYIFIRSIINQYTFINLTIHIYIIQHLHSNCRS